MFRPLKNLIYFIFIVFLIFVLHTGISYFFPYPFNQINPAYLFLTWFFVYRDQEKWLWPALGISIIMDLFSSLPFGVTSASILISLVLVRYLFVIIFTNYSWFNIFILGFTSLSVYKIISFGILSLLSIFIHGLWKINVIDIYVWLLEALVNALIFLFIYGIVKLLSPRKIYYGSL